jgi:hypothetical protein
MSEVRELMRGESVAGAGDEPQETPVEDADAAQPDDADVTPAEGELEQTVESVAAVEKS